MTRIIRSGRTIPVREGDLERQLENLPESGRAERAAIDYAETVPAFSTFKVDSEGNLWVGDYQRPGEDRQNWSIFGPEGDLLGTLLTPPRLTIHDIGKDYVLGSVLDELDVQRVALYGLHKSLNVLSSR